ncbi:MAG: hypothetical protein WA883_17740 [Phormidesmis sp.]
MPLSSSSSQPANSHEAHLVGTSTGDTDAVNQSPEQAAFEMPLFPGYEESSQAAAAYVFPSAYISTSDVDPAIANSDPDTAKLLQQLEELRQQMNRQTQRHRAELSQLDSTWQKQFTALTAAPSADPLVPHQPASQPSHSTYQSTQRILSHIPTTYQVSRRTRVGWIENFLGSVPAFLWLVMLGMVIAGLCAIALSPTILWPSMSQIIRSAIPPLFVVGLVSLAITAVWDTFG